PLLHRLRVLRARRDRPADPARVVQGRPSRPDRLAVAGGAGPARRPRLHRPMALGRQREGRRQHQPDPDPAGDASPLARPAIAPAVYSTLKCISSTGTIWLERWPKTPTHDP